MKTGDIIEWGENCLGKVVECISEEYNDFIVEMIVPFSGTTTTWLGDDPTPYKIVGHED